jgi:hypothetical protein
VTLNAQYRQLPLQTKTKPARSMRQASANQSMKPTQQFVVSSLPMRTLIFKVLDGLSPFR